MKKWLKLVLGCIVTVVIIILLGLIMFYSAQGASSEQHYDLQQQIKIEDSVATPKSVTKEFTIDEDYDYVFDMEWKSEPGMITGVSVRDEEGKSVFSCTAECVTVESEILTLQKGNYTITYYFLTSEEELNQFIQDQQMEMTGDQDEEPYAWAANLDESVTYSFKVNKNFEYNMGKKFGILTGVILGLFLVYTFSVVTKKDNTAKCQYDERQELVRGRGFKYAYFVICGYSVLLLLLNILEVNIPADNTYIIFLGLALGICTYSGYSIWNEGYFALNERKNGVMGGILIIGAFNLIIGIQNILSYGLLEEGKLSVHSLNLLCGILLTVIFCIVLAKSIKDRRESANEES